jgi:hypothetical protein
MFTLLTGFPENTIAIAASGQITRDDYTKVLIPRVRDGFAKFAKLRVYYEIGEDFAGFAAGAAWEDFALGMAHLRDWERVAFVTDVAWMRHAAAAFQFLMPGQVRVFSIAEAPAARHWISAAA